MTSHSPERENHRSFYDRISAVYDLIADGGEHEARKLGEEALGVREGERVLEIGCGTGNSLVRFARDAGPTGKVTALDVSPRMLATARRKLEKEELGGRVELEEGDARALPFPDEAFDATFLSFTLEIFEDDEIGVVLAEIRRVLKPGGRVGVVTMAVGPAGADEGFAERTYRWMHQHFPHIVDCHPIDVDGLLEVAGFETRSRTGLEIWGLPVAVVVAASARTT